MSLPPVQPAQPMTPEAGVFPPRAPIGDAPAITSITPLNRPWSAIFAVTAVFISLIALFVVYFLNVQTSAKIKSHENDIQTVTTSLNDAKLAEAETKIKQITAAISGYQAAAAQQLDYAALYGDIEQRLPKNALLDSFLLDEKGAVRVSGTADSFVTVAKSFLSLRRSSLIKDVVLSGVSLTAKENSKVITFTLTGSLNTAHLMKKTADTATDQSTGL